MEFPEEQNRDAEVELEQMDVFETEPDSDYICKTTAWIGTDLVECLEAQGVTCRFADRLSGSTVFCTCQPRKYAAQVLHKWS